jgi:hypothetical protein
MARGSHSSRASRRAAAGTPGPTAPRRSRSSSGRSRRPRIALPVPHIGDEPGDRLIAAGIACFVLGLIAIAVIFLPFVFRGNRESGLLWGLGSFLAVVGLALAMAGLYRQIKSRD